MYIYQNSKWPDFNFNSEQIRPLLEECHFEQGRLISRMNFLGLSDQENKILSVITSDVIKSNEIEGFILNQDQVRSSVARRLGLQVPGLISSDRNIDAVVEMMLDASQNYDKEITEERLLGWHACLFPTGYSGMYKIDTGKYRTNPMQVISGGIGHEKIHYEAPSPDIVPAEMKTFLKWFNNFKEDGYIKTAIAHLWFLTIHPFDDGNGRIARALSDMLLSRSDRTSNRYYSMSAQIMNDRNTYYQILEKTQKSDLDITEWITWFLLCILNAIKSSFAQTEDVIKKYNYLNSIKEIPLNERQYLMISKVLDSEWYGVLNTSKWGKIAKCSGDTALRDITDLVQKGILKKSPTSGGRSTNYTINF